MGDHLNGRHAEMPFQAGVANVVDLNLLVRELNVIRSQREELAQQWLALKQNQEKINGTSPPNPSVPMGLYADNGYVKHDKPSKFDGKNVTGIMVDNWIYAVQKYVLATGLDGERAVSLAVSFTEDIALQFSRNTLQMMQSRRDRGCFGMEYLPLINLDAYMAMIRENFYPVDATQKNRDALNALRQVRSVAEYVSEFRALLMQVPAEEWTEADMKDRFLRNLKPKHREFTLMKDTDDTTLNGTFQNALRADSILFGNTAGNNHGFGIYIGSFQARASEDMSADSADPNAMDVDAVKINYERRSYRQRNNVPKKYGVCWDCDLPGHRRGDSICSKVTEQPKLEVMGNEVGRQ